MKKAFVFLCIVSFALIFVSFASAQVNTNTAGFRGQSISGATGLFGIPTGRVGWDKEKDFGLDFGYRAIINNNAGVAHIPAITMTLFKTIELSSAFDIQPDIRYNYHPDNKRENNDFLFGLKIKLPTTPSTAVALGGNVQMLNLSNNRYNYNAYQPYVAITYMGNFFKMPAETTIVFGKTFYSGGPSNNSNIDFGMGFDVILFPDVFRNTVHWIIDFANFAYSDNAWPNHSTHHSDAPHRGVMNTGFRLDLSTIPALNKYKFNIDFIFNDLFDAGHRSFTIGAVFGLEI